MRPRGELALHWKDLNGDRAHTTGHWQADPVAALGSLETVVAACVAMSGARLEYVQLAATKEYGTPLVATPYPTVRDRCVFLFRCDNEERFRITVVAPQPDIFLLGSSRVDLDHPKVEALVSAATANLSAQAGGVAVTLADAWRMQVKLK